jgi:hypothetical protein
MSKREASVKTIDRTGKGFLRKGIFLSTAFAMMGLASTEVTARVSGEALGGEFEITGFISTESRARVNDDVYLTQQLNRLQLEMSLNYESKGIFDSLSFVSVLRPEFDAAYYYGDDLTGGHVGRRAHKPSYLGIPFSFANDPIGYGGFDVLFGGPGALSTGGLSKNVIQGVWDARRLSQFEVVAYNTAFPLLSPLSDDLLACDRCITANDSFTNMAFGRTGSSGALYPFRELYVDGVAGDLWFRIGKQQIVWGKTDFFRMQDIINPVDFGQHFFFDSFEDIRIPQWIASFQYKPGSIGPLEDTAVQLVWNFDRFRPVGLGNHTQAWAHPFGKEFAVFSAFNTYFTPEPCISADTATAAGADVSTICQPGDGRMPSGFGIPVGLGSDDRPKWKFSNTEIGGRFEFRVGGVRFALSHYYGWGDTPIIRFNTVNVNAATVPIDPALVNDNLVIGLAEDIKVPVAVLDPNQAIAAAAAGGDPDAIAALAADNARLFYQTGKVIGGRVSLVYERAHTTGLSFDYFEENTGIVFRIESSITFNEIVQNTHKANWVDHSNVVRWSIGMDRPTFIRFLNPNRTFFLSAQLFDTWYTDHEGDANGGFIVGKHNYIATFFAQTHYLRDQLIPQGFIVWEEQSHSWVFGTSVEYLFNNHVSIAAGANVIWGGTHNMTHDVGPFTSFTLDGNYAQEAVFGLAREGIGALRKNDEVFMRLKYQF